VNKKVWQLKKFTYVSLSSNVRIATHVVI